MPKGVFVRRVQQKTAEAVEAYRSGQTVAQIATASGVSTTAVYTKLRRAGVCVERRGMSYREMGKRGGRARSEAVPPLTDRIIEGSVGEPNTGCWLWERGVTTRSRDGMMRGHLSVGNKTVSAYRASYEAFRGPIPSGLDIDHLCRLPLCVNPAHLEPVTHKVNQERGRGSRTHCKRGHDFAEHAVVVAYSGRTPVRRCRKCGAIRQRGYAAAR